jgi:hypothetical protein
MSGDGDGNGDGEVTVSVRGIYATALTRLFGDDDRLEVVQASPPIRRRFETDFGTAPAAVAVRTGPDRQGVCAAGRRAGVVGDLLAGVGLDTLAWPAALPEGAVFEGRVTDTLGGGAVVDCGPGEGYLPYGAVDAHVEDGDAVRVQVRESAPPWGDDRPELDGAVAVDNGLGRLVRGAGDAGGLDLADVLPVDAREGWGLRWDRRADDAGLEALRASIEDLNERAAAVDAALEGGTGDGPRRLTEGRETRWVWFGRASREGLDGHRREVTATMPGHHRIKAGSDAASAAVDFAEAVCDPAGEFPFDAVARQFGPQEGDRLALGHGKPDGRLIVLGRGEVTDYDPGGTVTVEREMSPGGTYDALGVERRAGDVAVTKLTEGRWWYPTVYRGDDGTTRGTYVNVCTPVELFPGTARYVDLHVDVVKHPDGRVERVDDDELDEAVAAGHLSEALAEKARAVASAVENAL